MTKKRDSDLPVVETDPYRMPMEVAETSERPSKFPAVSVLVCVGIIAIAFVVVCLRYAPGFRDAPQSTNSTASTLTFETESGPVEEPASIKPFIQKYGMTRGGAHRIMGDGEVEFIVDTETKAGDVDVITPSGKNNPYGLWGRLGSRANPATSNAEESADQQNTSLGPSGR